MFFLDDAILSLLKTFERNYDGVEDSFVEQMKQNVAQQNYLLVQELEDYVTKFSKMSLYQWILVTFIAINTPNSSIKLWKAILEKEKEVYQQNPNEQKLEKSLRRLEHRLIEYEGSVQRLLNRLKIKTGNLTPVELKAMQRMRKYANSTEILFLLRKRINRFEDFTPEKWKQKVQRYTKVYGKLRKEAIAAANENFQDTKYCPCVIRGKMAKFPF